MRKLLAALAVTCGLLGIVAVAPDAQASPSGHCPKAVALVDPAFVACQQAEFAAEVAADAAYAAAHPEGPNPHNVGGGWLLSGRGNQESMFRFDLWEFRGVSALADAIAYRDAHASTVAPCNGLQTLCDVGGGKFRVLTLQQIPGVASKTG